MASKPLPLRIRRIEDKENKGSHGAWRREFCKTYSEQLSKGRENAYHALLTSLSAEGKTISCRQGCTHCCHHYVTVSLAQGIVIVDYLYRRKDLLNRFLDQYERWRQQAESISNDIDRQRTRALSSSTPIDQVIAETRPLSNRYFASNIPCPFLTGDRCSIYPLRPPSCSAHHAVSPPDWCAAESQQAPEIHRSVFGDKDVIDLVKLTDPRLSLFELSLPTMVYRLLTEGSTALMAEVEHDDFR